MGDGPEWPPPLSSTVATARASEGDAAAVVRSLGDDVGPGFGRAPGGIWRFEPGSGAAVDGPAVVAVAEPGVVVPGIVEKGAVAVAAGVGWAVGAVVGVWVDVGVAVEMGVGTGAVPVEMGVGTGGVPVEMGVGTGVGTGVGAGVGLPFVWPGGALGLAAMTVDEPNGVRTARHDSPIAELSTTAAAVARGDRPAVIQPHRRRLRPRCDGREG